MTTATRTWSPKQTKILASIRKNNLTTILKRTLQKLKMILRYFANTQPGDNLKQMGQKFVKLSYDPLATKITHVQVGSKH
jgi:hypothetical protein